MGRKKSPGLIKRGQHWHIEKRIGGKRLRVSTGTGKLDEAEAILSQIIATHQRAKFFGERPKVTFRKAATKYLQEETKKSIHNDAQALKALDPFVGDLYLEQVHHDTLMPFVVHMRNTGRAAGTINRYIAVARRILNLAAKLWRHTDTGLTWLESAPMFVLEKGSARKPYPINWEEQKLLISELSVDLANAALFMINTGLRDQELCSLRWEWRIDENSFVLPEDVNKNGRERLVVLNSISKSIIESQNNKDKFRVFPRSRIYTRGWKNGRSRAADRYQEVLGEACPWGFRNLRVHDLRHTFGRRIRHAGWSNEDRKDLLGHKNDDITTHYSKVEISRLQEMVESITKPYAHKMPTLKAVGE